MCLAIPAKVVLINENDMAQVDIHGVIAHRQPRRSRRKPRSARGCSSTPASRSRSSTSSSPRSRGSSSTQIEWDDGDAGHRRPGRRSPRALDMADILPPGATPSSRST